MTNYVIIMLFISNKKKTACRLLVETLCISLPSSTVSSGIRESHTTVN
mgnify:CR=1 FL=1